MTISPQGISLIKRFAPLNLTAHHDTHGWQIGYACRDYGSAAKGWRVMPSETYRITVVEAERLLLDRADHAANLIEPVAPVASLSQNELDALICHIYFMVRMQEFHQSEIARYLMEGNKPAAGNAILCDISDTERERRTIAEAYLFRKGT